VSDPGWGRLRQAVGAVICVASTLPIQYVVARALDFPASTVTVTALFGSIIAVLGWDALAAKRRREVYRAAAVFPIAVATGVAPAMSAADHPSVQAVGFVLAIFAAVWVRRLGPDWTSYGFLMWIGYFFATFLQARWDLFPEMMAATMLSSAWVALLGSSILRHRPDLALQATLRAFIVQSRAVARACAEQLEGPSRPRRHERRSAHVDSRRATLAETAVLVDAWSAEPGALPTSWSATALRRRCIETHQAVDRFAMAAVALRAGPGGLREEAARALEHVARRHDLAALASAERLDALADEARRDGDEFWWPSRHVAYGVTEFVRLASSSGDQPEEPDGEEVFESVSKLVLGRLPGSPAVAVDVAARAHRWNPVGRMSLTTRQAVQATLACAIAVVAGSLLSPERYYWAVITVLVTITGTSTRSETFLRGAARVSGTLAGLAAAIALARLTSAYPVALVPSVLMAVFGVFYYAKASFAWSTFFVTILLGQMYAALGAYNDSLLQVRLGETLLGVAAGVAVAVAFAPLSTQDTVNHARRQVLEALGDLLDAVARRLDGASTSLDAVAYRLEDHARSAALVSQPLIHPLLTRRVADRNRRSLDLHLAAVTQARALVVAVQRRRVADPATARAAAMRLAKAAHSMGALRSPTATADILESTELSLFTDPEALRGGDPATRQLHHLASTLRSINELEEGQPGSGD
jgi:hypothetical protein